MAIKFVDLAAQTAEIADEVAAGFAAVHAMTAYVGGPAVATFERAFAEFLGVAHVIGVGSGTDALRLALVASGIGPGDAVITTPLTFIATAAAIVQTGARPVFVDVDPATGNICPKAVKRYLETPPRDLRVRAVVAVDLYGLPAALRELRELATAYGLKLIEDACQAHGARIKIGGAWHMAGSGELADAAAFSFYPGKNLGGWGEGGAVATDSATLAARIARLRDHGRLSHYAHDELGYNARLDTLQAVVLAAKLKRLAGWNARRREVAALYAARLADCGAELPITSPGYESAYHLYVIHTDRRDAVRTALEAAGIGCGIHYPLPLHLQPALSYLGYHAGDLPVAERLAGTALSLPMHPHLKDDEVEQVAAVVRASLGHARRAAA